MPRTIYTLLLATACFFTLLLAASSYYWLMSASTLLMNSLYFTRFVLFLPSMTMKAWNKTCSSRRLRGIFNVLMTAENWFCVTCWKCCLS